MKRILTVFPAVICLILSLCVPLAASAGVNVRPGGEIYTYYSLEQFKTKYNYTDESYLYVQSFFPDSDYRTNSLYLQTSADKISSVEEDNGVYKVSFTDSVTLTRIQSEYGGSFDSGYDFSVLCFIYDSNNNTIVFYSGFNFTSEVWIPGDWVVYQVDSNILNSTVLPDVVVKFKPPLHGTVDRVVTNSDGTTSKLQDLQMHVHNNSKFPIQYRMQITLSTPYQQTKRDYNQIFDYSESVEGVTTEIASDFSTLPTASPDTVLKAKKDWLNVHYDDDPVFIYYSNTVTYEGAIIPDSVTRDGDNPMLYNKASAWHKVDSKSGDDVIIPFSMINLKENYVYNVIVECYRLDLDYVCDIIRPNTCTTPHVDVDTYVIAYNDTFKFTSYSDIIYNPNQTSGDVLPFDGTSGIVQKFSYDDNYDAVTDLKTGEQTIGHRDFLKDPNSWYNNGTYESFSGGLVSGSSDFSISSFSGMFSQVFGAVKMFTNYLPSSIMTIFVFGFSSIVVIAIIKAVR